MPANATPRRCFTRDYELGRFAAVREIERAVLGCDYGATSWTTRDEARIVADLLGLRTRVCLLTRDGIAERCRAVVADGAALPFADGSFEAISHSDVLCCMPAKLSLLQECRRVARAGATMVFSVIAPADALSVIERRIAIESGPEFVDVEGDYPTLLEQSDWRVLQHIDVTDRFAQSIRASLQAMHANADALVAALGNEDYCERVKRRQVTLVGLDRCVLKRELFAATTRESL